MRKSILPFCLPFFLLSFFLRAEPESRIGIDWGRKLNGGEIGQGRHKEFVSLEKGIRFEAPQTWSTLENKPLLIVSDPHASSLHDSSKRISFVLVESPINNPEELEAALKKISSPWDLTKISGKSAFYRHESDKTEIWVFRQAHNLIKIEVQSSIDDVVTKEVERLLLTLQINTI